MLMDSSMCLYINTPVEAMTRLDDDRYAAEAEPDTADWFDLARRYEAQGRPAQAGSCRRRGEYYSRVSVETVVMA
jgi:hypothetical protein